MSLTASYYTTNYETVVPEKTLGANQSGEGSGVTGMEPVGKSVREAVSWRRAPRRKRCAATSKVSAVTDWF